MTLDQFKHYLSCVTLLAVEIWSANVKLIGTLSSQGDANVAVRTTFGGILVVLLTAGLSFTQVKADNLDSTALSEISGSVVGNSAIASSSLNRSNSLDGGFDGASGVSVVQQNNGDNNLINAAVSVVDLSEVVGSSIPSASAMISTAVSGNSATYDGGQLLLSNVISNAFNGASGVMIVQQNNGSNNAISAAVSVSGNGGLAALNFLP